MVERKCENCDYYAVDTTFDDLTAGRCRRYAPNPTTKEKGFDWERVNGHEDWCGEFAPKGTYERMFTAFDKLSSLEADLDDSFPS